MEIAFGPEFTTAVCFAPLKWQYICVEPQTGTTNAFNLVHEGKISNSARVGAGEDIYRDRSGLFPAGIETGLATLICRTSPAR